MRLRLGTALLALALVLLTACEGAWRAGGGPADLTPRAVAAVMLDHLSNDTSTREAALVDETSPDGLVGAEVLVPRRRPGLGHITSRSASSVGVDPGCDGAQCVDLGEGTALSWQKVQVESDPGIVLIRHQRGDELVTVLFSGPDITGDPREMDLDPDVEKLIEIARDPRLELTTTKAVVAAGERVDDWEGGEVDPAELEMVQNNDRTVVMSWLGAHRREMGGPVAVQEAPRSSCCRRPCPRSDPVPFGPVTIDGLAAPEPPAWLGQTCRPTGYRCDEIAGFTFIWRPARGADPGDAFVWFVRDDGETVGFHSRGRRLPDNAKEAAGRAGLYWFSDGLDYPEAVRPLGYTTSRRLFEEFDGPIGVEPPPFDGRAHNLSPTTPS